MPSATSAYISPANAPLTASSRKYMTSIASHLHDRQLALGHAGLSGLVDDLCLHGDARPAAVDGLDDRRIARFDHVAPQFARARDLAVVGIELLVQADEAPQSQRLGQRGVDAAHRVADQLRHLGL